MFLSVSNDANRKIYSLYGLNSGVIYDQNGHLILVSRITMKQLGSYEMITDLFTVFSVYFLFYCCCFVLFFLSTVYPSTFFSVLFH